MPYRTIVNFLGGAVKTVSEFYEDVTETVRSITPEPIGKALDTLAGTVEQAVSKTPIGVAERGAAATGEMVSRSTGNKALGGTVGFALGVAAGGPAVGGAAKRVIPKGLPKPKPTAAPPVDMMMPPGMAPAMAGVAPMPTPQIKPTVQSGAFKLTITEPEFIAPGVRQGIAETPANVKARQMLDKSIERLDKRRAQLEADVKSGKIEYKSTRWKGKDKKIREERYGEMSSFYNQLDQDPPAFNVAGEKHIDPTDITVKAEQHHLAAKAQTAPFIEAMLSVGDPDDLVALHEYSRMLGVVMGNSKRNMLDAPSPIHRAAVAKTAQEKAGNIHSAFSVAGMEPNNAFVRNLLKDVKTADDVMRVFKQYADEYLIPQQDIARKIVKNYLSDYRIKLTPAQKAKFDELASKLN
jgi:hypothetical protein